MGKHQQTISDRLLVGWVARMNEYHFLTLSTSPHATTSNEGKEDGTFVALLPVFLGVYA